MKFFSWITILGMLTSCATAVIGSKISPEYTGVDPKAQPLVDEYMALSKQFNVTFTHAVTIGFKKINDKNVVGICNYGSNWREIDLDIDFWNNTDASERLALIFHELTHCYCGRGHDYGEGKNYPETEEGRENEAKNWNGGPKPGRYDDICPLSLMYPVVVSEDCLVAHYNDYIKEMFDRCQPF